MTSDWRATERQQARAQRSRALLTERQVPMWGDEARSLYVEDDTEIHPPSADDVAKRALVLWAVVLMAEGVKRAECEAILETHGIWEAASPSESAFLRDESPDPATAQDLVWRLEALWILLWALGHLDEVPWPSGMCDVPRIAEVLNPREMDPTFISDAQLIPLPAIVDQQDLTMKIHWAIRDAYIKGKGIPEDLAWRNPVRTHVAQCPVVGVVEQRHHTLNWILNFMSPKNWDEVDTPT